jgi:hypothetical protein
VFWRNQDYFTAVGVLKQLLTAPQYQDSKLTNLEKLVECYFRLNLIQEAGELIQSHSTSFCSNPRFILLEADLLAMTDPQKAITKYQKYLSLGYSKPNKYEAFDHKRFVTHPQLMLKELESLY